jgi:hypothetical protein
MKKYHRNFDPILVTRLFLPSLSFRFFCMPQITAGFIDTRFPDFEKHC